MNKKKLLEEIEKSADDAVLIVKEVQQKRKPKSEIPLRFDIADEDSISIKTNLVKYINSKNLVYQDLFDFCIKKTGEEKEGTRLAYSIIAGLKKQRNIRCDTIDILCEFLNVNVYIEERTF